MKKIIHIIIFLVTSSLTFGQGKSCSCYDGIGSTIIDQPSLTMVFKNGISLSICGYEQKKYSPTRIKISEFNVFDCKTKKPITGFGSLQTVEVKIENDTLILTELKYLPIGKEWQWELVPIGRQIIFLENDELQVSVINPFFHSTSINPELINRFFAKLEDIKGKGYNDQFEKIIGKLEVLALNGNKRAQNILTGFEDYFKFPPDGAIAEQINDAIATVNWMKLTEQNKTYSWESKI